MWLGYLPALWVFPNHWETDSLILLVARNWASRGMDEADNFVSPSNSLPHWARLDLISRGEINGWLWTGDMHLAGNNHIRKCTTAACGRRVAEWFKAGRVQEMHGNEQRYGFCHRQQLSEWQLHSLVFMDISSDFHKYLYGGIKVWMQLDSLYTILMWNDKDAHKSHYMTVVCFYVLSKLFTFTPLIFRFVLSLHLERSRT